MFQQCTSASRRVASLWLAREALSSKTLLVDGQAWRPWRRFEGCWECRLVSGGSWSTGCGRRVHGWTCMVLVLCSKDSGLVGLIDTQDNIYYCSNHVEQDWNEGSELNTTSDKERALSNMSLSFRSRWDGRLASSSLDKMEGATDGARLRAAPPWTDEPHQGQTRPPHDPRLCIANHGSLRPLRFSTSDKRFLRGHAVVISPYLSYSGPGSLLQEPETSQADPSGQPRTGFLFT